MDEESARFIHSSTSGQSINPSRVLKADKKFKLKFKKKVGREGIYQNSNELVPALLVREGRALLR